MSDYEDWITANQTKVSLGNYAQVTDGNGNLIESRGYDTFGTPRTGTWADF